MARKLSRAARTGLPVSLISYAKTYSKRTIITSQVKISFFRTVMVIPPLRLSPA
jgi:hypothetical protein